MKESRQPCFIWHRSFHLPHHLRTMASTWILGKQEAQLPLFSLAVAACARNARRQICATRAQQAKLFVPSWPSNTILNNSCAIKYKIASSFAQLTQFRASCLKDRQQLASLRRQPWLRLRPSWSNILIRSLAHGQPWSTRPSHKSHEMQVVILSSLRYLLVF